MRPDEGHAQVRGHLGFIGRNHRSHAVNTEAVSHRDGATRA